MKRQPMKRSKQFFLLSLIVMIALGSFATVMAGPISEALSAQQPVLPDRAPVIRPDEAPELRLQELGLDQLPQAPEAQRSPDTMQDLRNPPQGTEPLAVPGAVQPPDPAKAPER